MKQTRVAIYARVSGNGQNPEMQIKELQAYCRSRGWKIAGEYSDRTSGALDSRPELNRLMADANHRRFDAVAVWKFDRFARSVSHLLRALETFRALGIEFLSLSENDRYGYTSRENGVHGAWLRRRVGAVSHWRKSQGRSSKCKSEWSEIGQTFVARNQRYGDSAAQKRQKKDWRKFQSTCSEVSNFDLDGISSMQIKGLAIYRFLISSQGFKPSDQRVKKANVLLAFREAILARFSNNAFLAVLTALNRSPLPIAIEQGKEYRSS